MEDCQALLSANMLHMRLAPQHPSLPLYFMLAASCQAVLGHCMAWHSAGKPDSGSASSSLKQLAQAWRLPSYVDMASHKTV